MTSTLRVQRRSSLVRTSQINIEPSLQVRETLKFSGQSNSGLAFLLIGYQICRLFNGGSELMELSDPSVSSSHGRLFGFVGRSANSPSPGASVCSSSQSYPIIVAPVCLSCDNFSDYLSPRGRKRAGIILNLPLLVKLPGQ
jgi:hypothetical protein